MASPLNRRLSRLILTARAAIAWERLWPAVAPMVGVVVLFVSSAWMGLWIGLSPLVKILLLAAFAVLFVAAGWRLARFALPGRGDAMRRLEQDAALEHRPLSAYEDDLAIAPDRFSEGIWRVHRRRAEAALAALRWPFPRADLVPHDPFAVRSAVGIALFIGVLVGAGALAERLITPFDFSDPAETVAGPQFRLDAWVTPPSYTGRGPLFLSSATRVETVDGIRVPAGSVLTVRGQGVEGLAVVVSDGGGESVADLAELSADEPGSAAAQESTVVIDRPMAVEVRQEGITIDGWQFVADGDLPPSVRITEAPSADERRQGFEVRYALDDDYGIESAVGIVTPTDAPEDRRPLVDDPTFRLTLPGGRGMRGEARTTHDLSEHPYAGSIVSLTLEATDGAGQTGRSEPRTFRLPSRTFVNPLARAVVEQRAILAMDAGAHMDVVDTMDLLLMVAEDTVGAGGFLAMRAAYRDLVRAGDDDALRDMLDALWQLALILENDGMSDAERALQAAQERLRQALEDGASQDEIARLTEELREAMMNYMRQLAEQMQNMPQQPMDPNAQMLTQQNLDDMLRRLEELAREGRHEEAQALLNQLAQMMQNLQMAERGEGQQGDPMGEDGRMLDELGRMIQRQQELMDETFGMDEGNQQGQQGRFGNQQGQRQMPGQGGQNGEGMEGMEGMSPQERAEAMRRLQEQQSQLQQELEDMMRRLEERGFDPDQRLGDAGDSMGEAGEELGQGEPGQAVGDQADALDALREGAQGMAQQMAEARQGGEGEGEAMGPPDQGPGADPLGRTRRDGSVADTSRVQVPDEIEVQRARRILQELRNRLGDMDLPRIEREYLERLLP